MTDYAAQEEIRYNTYSGITLTGISANFGKVIAYLFETTPISKIVDNTNGEVIEVTSEKMLTLLKENNTSTIEGLLSKQPKYSVNEREKPKLKSRFGFKFDGINYDGFTRNTLSTTGKNVFETVDTIINLALDNVKMQKLHLLGITSANANVFLMMVGMGMPLNTVSRIFKNKHIVGISEGGRWTAQKLNERIELLQKELEEIESSDTDLLKRGISLQAILKDPSESLKLNVSSQLLEDIYTNNASKVDDLLVGMNLLSRMKQLLPVGEELFSHAQIYSTLRALPNKKTRIDQILDSINKFSVFTNEGRAKTNYDSLLKETLEDRFRNTEEYQLFKNEKGEEAAEDYLKLRTAQFMEAANKESSLSNYYEAIRAAINSRVIRRTNSRSISNTSESAFDNVSPIRLPHVLSAYRSLLTLQRFIEDLFYVHNPSVKAFVKNLIQSANMFTDFEAAEKSEIVSKELVKYLSADISFRLDGTTFSTSVADETYNTSDKSYVGKEAWKQNFLNKLDKAKQKVDDNFFLESLEMRHKNGLTTLKILSDKTNDEEALEALREGFASLIGNYDEIIPGYTYSNLAYDLFKYSAIHEGLFYERTGLSLIFPGRWLAAYSEALENRLKQVVPKHSSLTDINLRILRDSFLSQLMRTNPQLIRKTFSKPIVARTEKFSWGSKKILAGVDNVEGQQVHYDLKIPVYPQQTPSRFVRLYDDTVFMLMPTGSTTHAYYRSITSGTSSRSYYFDPSSIDESIDLQGLADFPHRLVDQSSIINGVLVIPKGGYQLEENQIIGAINKYEASADSIRVYKIISATTVGLDDKQSTRYKLALLHEEVLKDTAKAERLRKEYGTFLDTQVGVVTISDNLEKYRSNVLRNNHYLIGKRNEEFVARLPIFDATEDTYETLTKETIDAINSLPIGGHYYIEEGLLEDIPYEYREPIAKALFRKTGYKDYILKETSDELPKAALRRIEMNVGVIPPYLEVSEQDGIYSISRQGFISGLSSGASIFLRYGKYFFITSVNSNTVDGFIYDENLFMTLEGNESTEEFLEKYVKQINC